MYCYNQLLHLAVNALLKSNQVNEMEGGTLFGFEQDLNPNIHVADEHYYLDETTSSAPAFRVLKQLIQRCLADAVTSGNRFADKILQHMYRWLCRLSHFYLSVHWRGRIILTNDHKLTTVVIPKQFPFFLKCCYGAT